MGQANLTSQLCKASKAVFLERSDFSFENCDFNFKLFFYATCNSVIPLNKANLTFSPVPSHPLPHFSSIVNLKSCLP